MNTYGLNSIKNAVSSDPYVGRGIIIGMSPDEEKIAVAYFIMGRSENSRNRIFAKSAEIIKTQAFDPSLLTDPSLVIYSAVREINKSVIITNGDQTDTIYQHISEGKSFEDALRTRCFEPDSPNFTPRISGIIEDNKSYKLSILKSADADGNACNRFFFEYLPLAGVGHFIHTYAGDGNPLPTFTGEPKRVAIPDDIDSFAAEIWDNLDGGNKISLYVRYTDIASGRIEEKIINKNK